MEESKKCFKCGEHKRISAFHTKTGGKYGVSTICKSCTSAYYAAKHKERSKCPLIRAIDRAKSLRFYYANREQCMKGNRTRYLRDRKSRIAYSVDYLKKNSIKEKYKAIKLNAYPAWANDFYMSEAYDLARMRTKIMGFKWHVDHVIPLISKTVCGLHVEHNLQVIPAILNRIKGNRVWPDKP